MNYVSRKETVIELSASAVFLLLQWLIVGLTSAQLAMVLVFNVLFFVHPLTRKFALMGIPFVLFEISYDWMRLCPNYEVNPIDIQGLYDAEKALFGIATENGTLIPGEYFNLHHHPVADLLAGLFYLCWVPGPIAFSVWLFLKGERQWGLRFTWAFLLVNIIGFIGYYVHPAAPPWYAINYGFEPDFTTPANSAGLARFDELIGFPLFATIYVKASNIFAAVPSLHAAYMLTATIYAIMSRQPRWLITLCGIISVGIWCTAVYTCHHYIIDVLLGIMTALIGIALFEGVLMRWSAFQRIIQTYTKYIS
ncbi:MAG: inositol phosphorylceramide synthase [Prevotella sp.]|nr:inositol phosphorylceramide synthase [Prevotella sp.]